MHANLLEKPPLVITFRGTDINRNTRYSGLRSTLGIAASQLAALTARGIASCAQGALSLFPDIVREHLGVPETHKLLFGVSFGYEDPNVKANAARVGRASLDDAVQFHR